MTQENLNSFLILDILHYQAWMTYTHICAYIPTTHTYEGLCNCRLIWRYDFILIQHHKINSKFQILDKAFVIRHQFPIASAYAITIHKSQGLTLHNVVIDIGNNVFTCGQSYVALSRVTSLSGLYLINSVLKL